MLTYLRRLNNDIELNKGINYVLRKTVEGLYNNLTYSKYFEESREQT